MKKVSPNAYKTTFLCNSNIVEVLVVDTPQERTPCYCQVERINGISCLEFYLNNGKEESESIFKTAEKEAANKFLKWAEDNRVKRLNRLK